MRQVYAERIAVLAEATKQRLGGLLEVEHAVAGMRTVAWLKSADCDLPAAQRAWASGLELAAVSQFRIRHPYRPGLVLGFAGCSPAELRRGVSVLARALSP
jgi:GntR family transcriptional regulator/MocR family aminotransferase